MFTIQSINLLDVIQMEYILNLIITLDFHALSTPFTGNTEPILITELNVNYISSRHVFD